MAVADRGGTIDAVQISLLILTIAAVAFRFLARRLSGAGLWWDDWMILAALPLSLGCNIANIIAVQNGLGKHLYNLSANAATSYRRNLFVDELMYNTCLALIKFSVLLMYRRTFWPRRVFTWVLNGTAVTVVMWWLGTEIPIIFQCNPIHKTWNTGVTGTCIDIEAFFLAQAIPNIITDIFILILPLPQVWKLEMALSNKIALCCVFLLGSFTAASSLVRLNIIIHLSQVDITWNFYAASIWSALEPGVGIISACLPCMRVYFCLFPGRHGQRHTTTSQRSRLSTQHVQQRRQQIRSRSEIDDIDSVSRLQPDDIAYHAFISTYHDGTGRDETKTPNGSEYPLERIHVKSQVTWDRAQAHA